MHRLMRPSRCCFAAAGTRNRAAVLLGPSKCVTRRFISNYSSDAGNENDAIKTVLEWTKKFLPHEEKPPVFAVDGDQLTVLTEPQEFYQILKTKASKVQKRIVLASLYLGTGKLEQELVDTIYQRSKELTKENKDFKVHILLDHPRGSRGKKNSRTMLLPLLKDFTENVRVSLYHPPKLRGLLLALIPERFNEVISAMHLKVYIFDDTLVMSGANLSNDYFTNRQDRCMVFENCKELCDYFHDLVSTVSSFSLELCPDDTTDVCKGFSGHPYKGTMNTFIESVKKIMGNFMRKYKNYGERNVLLDSMKTSEGTTKHTEIKSDINRKDEFRNDKMESQVETIILDRQTKLKSTKNDTLIIPSIQMHQYGIIQDEEITSRLFQLAPAESDIFLATAYFNVTSKHWNDILKTKSRNFDVVMAHPKANGFYKAPGPAGGIPHAYTLIAKQCYRDTVRFKQQDRIRFWEYQRPRWTFHGKGLWAQFHDGLVPHITMIGSSNFGNRSVYRDLEAQLTIVTTNEELSKQLVHERENFLEYSNRVDTYTYAEKERKVPAWVFLIRTFMRTFF